MDHKYEKLLKKYKKIKKHLAYHYLDTCNTCYKIVDVDGRTVLNKGYCDQCKKATCEKHRITCVECGKNDCNKCSSFGKCFCGEFKCYDCCDHDVCQDCGIGICKKCDIQNKIFFCENCGTSKCNKCNINTFKLDYKSKDTCNECPL